MNVLLYTLVKGLQPTEKSKAFNESPSEPLALSNIYHRYSCLLSTQAGRQQLFQVSSVNIQLVTRVYQDPDNIIERLKKMPHFESG